MFRLPLAFGALLVAGAAQAHPHVWVTAKAEMVYAPDGKITAIRHHWTFDPVYSTFVTRGLDANGDGKITPDELQELAKTNAESITEYDYFTVLKVNGVRQAFDAPRDYGMKLEGDALTLTLTLPLKAPASNRLANLEVYDATAFVSFTLASGSDAVVLNGSPKGCATTVTRPKPIEAAQQEKMTEAFFEALTTASTYGANFANRVLVACP